MFNDGHCNEQTNLGLKERNILIYLAKAQYLNISRESPDEDLSVFPSNHNPFSSA